MKELNYKQILSGGGKKFLYLLLAISLLCNVLAILPYVNTYYNKIERKYFPPQTFSVETPDQEVLDKVCKTTLCLKGVKMSMNENHGLPQDLKAFFSKKRNTETKNNFFTAYAMVGMSYYAAVKRDSLLMNEIKKKSENFINSKESTLTYPITKIDQAPIGILFLNLYKWYKDPVYLNVAKKLFEKVKTMRQPNGVIMYSAYSNCNYVDALGMYVPFLMEYYNETTDTLAYQIADFNMKEYYKYGVNHATGIPAHGYNTKNGIQVGSINWGRGIGWYLLAAAYCPQIDDKNLMHSLSVSEYTQFPGNSEHFDSSTALMFEIYKQSKQPNRQLSLDFIKPHIRTNGYIDDCSGDTYNFNSYSQSFSESELCNGLLLILASRFSNKLNEY